MTTSRPASNKRMLAMETIAADESLVGGVLARSARVGAQGFIHTRIRLSTSRVIGLVILTSVAK
jgi:hypothetical protein